MQSKNAFDPSLTTQRTEDLYNAHMRLYRAPSRVRLDGPGYRLLARRQLGWRAWRRWRWTIKDEAGNRRW